MAMGICFKHKLADAATAANFLKTSGLLACSCSRDNDFNKKHRDDSTMAHYDINSIFAGRDLQDKRLSRRRRQEIVEEMESSCLDRPTRFEVVSSVILGALFAACRGVRDYYDDELATTPPPRNVTATVAMNLRKRMNPPLPEQSFGNIYSAAVLNLPIDYNGIWKKINYNSLAGELR
ncbi:uncharacterized protein LOC18039473 [Citrus clementina]|nr:uncharacterized protein LOC18039473 [Citrus x clementina]